VNDERPREGGARPGRPATATVPRSCDVERAWQADRARRLLDAELRIEDPGEPIDYSWTGVFVQGPRCAYLVNLRDLAAVS
jgi:hypothetical protein